MRNDLSFTLLLSGIKGTQEVRPNMLFLSKDYGEKQGWELMLEENSSDRNNSKDDVIVVCNFTQVVRQKYRIGVPKKGKLTEIFNSDATVYGGSGVKNPNKLIVDAFPYDGRDYSIELLLPPLSVTVYKY